MGEILLRRYVRLLASSGAVGVSTLLAMPGAAVAQNVLDPVSVSGQSACPTGQTRVGGTCQYWNSGGGGGGSNGNIPENEAQGGTPAPPPPKTPEQREIEKAKCESNRLDYRAEVSNIYQANMAFCASSNGTSYGYFVEQWKRFLYEVVNIGPGNCAIATTANYNRSNYEIDVIRDRCVAKAQNG